ncbi:MAG: thioredoxin domain-containing protein, partial [Nannocystaceae bacterium]|nr:thioredoxin domain-containing protein [Nannocystaceae bacterium]
PAAQAASEPEPEPGHTLQAPVQRHTEPVPPRMPEPAAPIAADAATVAAAPAPAASVDPMRRPPVKNALIRPGERPATGPTPIAAPRGPRRWPKRAALVAAIVAGITALGAAAWWAVRWFGGRAPTLATTIARELPDDALGFLAFAPPRTQLELLGDAMPEALRKSTTERWGFDPFTLAAWSDHGLDPDGIVGVGWLDATKPTIAISAGLQDRAKLQATLPAVLAKLGAGKEPTITERSFGDVPGLWLEEPAPTAILLRDDRVVAIVGFGGSDASNVARHAERVAGVTRKTSLASREGFEALRGETGEPVVFGYVDGVSMRSAIPATAAEMLALRMAFAEVDAMSLALLRDKARIGLATQVVVRDGSTSMRYVEGVRRSGDALQRIPGPAIVLIDTAIATKPIADAAIAFTTMAGLWTKVDADFRSLSNLDLRADVIDNLAGEQGAALLALPSKPGGTDFAALAWVRMLDGAKASKSLAAAIPALQQHVFEIPPSSETIGDVTVHTFALGSGEREVRLSLFVAADHLWFAAGKVDVRAIIDRPEKNLHDAARNAAIRDAVAPGDVVHAFLDVHELVAKLDPLLDESDKAEKTAAQSLWSPLDVLTYRMAADGRLVRIEMVAHTTADDGLATMLRAAVTLSGERAATALARAQRRADCEKLVATLEAIGTTDTSRTLPEFSLRFDVRDACETKAKPEQITCALAAKSFADVEACGGAAAGLLPTEPEPQPVPYVDDIWPNTRPESSDSGRPRAEVNYGVEIGPEPQTRGRDDALVTIVEFGDFQCPYCREVTATLDEVLARHGNNVRLVFRHNPLPIHPEARNAAKAALAAARQGKFWAMHDKLFESQFELAPAKYPEYAAALGLDAARFAADFADPALDRRLDEDVAVAKRFGVSGTPAFFVNGRFLSGNQSLAVFDALVNEELSRARTFVERRGNTRTRLYEDMITRFAPEVTKSAAVALPPDSGERFTIATDGLPNRGATGFSRVRLVECGDFDCPYCARATKTIDRIVADYPTQVTVYFLHNPLSFHAGAEPAARAAAAADKQGKFWQMHDKLFGAPEAHSTADFVAYAKELKLDVAQFEKDLAAPETAKLVADQKKICEDNGGSSTPTFFLNGRRIEGAQSFDTFKALIDAELSGGI